MIKICVTIDLCYEIFQTLLKPNLSAFLLLLQQITTNDHHKITLAYNALTLAMVTAEGCPGSSPACSINDDNLAIALSRLQCMLYLELV